MSRYHAKVFVVESIVFLQNFAFILRLHWFNIFIVDFAAVSLTESPWINLEFFDELYKMKKHLRGYYWETWRINPENYFNWLMIWLMLSTNRKLLSKWIHMCLHELVYCFPLVEKNKLRSWTPPRFTASRFSALTCYYAIEKAIIPGLTSQRHSALISSDSEYSQVCFSAVHTWKSALIFE